MALSIGIVGLPNVGKSTLFTALTRKGGLAANYPFATIDPNVGIVDVPDERLQKLADIVHPARIVPATVEFVDIAGLVRGANEGEGLGNQFLSNIRNTDAICEVVRYFSDPDVVHVDGRVDPASDVDTIQTEFFLKVTIGIGSVVGTVKELARSYKDAQVALEVGKVFDTEKTVINYENLGIGRLIYQLPTTLCEMFLSEVFKRGSLESLDRETLQTIHSFFDNNLNVSETSRKLFVHRNTLVYRLEKIKKITGLDLREFDHAITFKVALMVKKYLSSKPQMY